MHLNKKKQKELESHSWMKHSDADKKVHYKSSAQKEGNARKLFSDIPNFSSTPWYKKSTTNNY